MKKTIQNEYKKLKNNCSKLYKEFKKNPKKALQTLLTTCVEIIKNNTLFFVFVVTNVFIGILLRYFTIHTMENLFLIKIHLV